MSVRIRKLSTSDQLRAIHVMLRDGHELRLEPRVDHVIWRVSDGRGVYAWGELGDTSDLSPIRRGVVDGLVADAVAEDAVFDDCAPALDGAELLATG